MHSFDFGFYPALLADAPARYHSAAFRAYATLGNALGYEQGEHVVPDVSNAQLIANGRFEGRIPLRPQSYIWAYSAYSAQPEGFTVQIIDLSTGMQFFQNPEKHGLLSGKQVDPYGINFPLCILPAPKLVLAPGVLSVRVMNLSASANEVQFVIFTAEPPVEGIRVKNAHNLLLDAEAALAARAIRGGFAPGIPGPGSGSGSGAGGSGIIAPAVEDLSQPIEIAGAGTYAVLPGFTSYRIAIHELQLYTTAAADITLWDGATRKLQGTFTNFPGGAGFYLPPSERPHFRLTAGNPFIIETTGALAGFVNYRMLSA
jgi:hypothetical protein